MRHRVAGFKLDRKSSSRKALYRMLVTDFLRHGSIRTTEAKAKSIQPIAERIISLGKKGRYQDKRMVARFINDPKIQEKVFGEIPDIKNDWRKVYGVVFDLPLAFFEIIL